jgi:hypothetical protein
VHFALTTYVLTVLCICKCAYTVDTLEYKSFVQHRFCYIMICRLSDAARWRHHAQPFRSELRLDLSGTRCQHYRLEWMVSSPHATFQELKPSSLFLVCWGHRMTIRKQHDFVNVGLMTSHDLDKPTFQSETLSCELDERANASLNYAKRVDPLSRYNQL